MSVGMPLAWAVSCFLGLKLLFPYNRENTIYAFTPEKLTQFVWGRRVKEIGLGAGLMVYRKGRRAQPPRVRARRDSAGGEPRRMEEEPGGDHHPLRSAADAHLKVYFDKANAI